MELENDSYKEEAIKCSNKLKPLILLRKEKNKQLMKKAISNSYHQYTSIGRLRRLVLMDTWLMYSFNIFKMINSASHKVNIIIQEFSKSLYTPISSN